MTDAQEIILDYLMGAEKIGPYWSTGPLGLAVRALQEKRLSSRRDASQALGYPGVLCHAVQGASSVLKGADERRKLAISVFAAVPTRPTIPRLTRQRSVEVATWAALRVHPLAHSDPCPYATLLTRRRQQYLDNGSWLEGRFPVDHEALARIFHQSMQRHQTTTALRV